MYQNDRKGGVSVLFAGAAVPIIGMLGLAIDYTFYAQARNQMAIAADGAAISAVRLAASEFIEPVAGWQQDAVNNGTSWFKMQLSSLRGASLAAASPTVTVPVPTGTTFTSQVAYSGTVPARFARLFGFPDFYVNGSSGATIQINAYVNIALLLDNSSSMLIGATNADVQAMENITPCSPMAMGSNQGMSAWTGPTPSACTTTYTPTTGGSYLTGTPSSLAPIAGKTPTAAPCGFACHWSKDNQTNNNKPDYTQYDYYALAANPTKYGFSSYAPPNLRFAEVQSAAAQVIQTMSADEVLPNQFGLTIFTFGNTVTQVYPATGEAGYDLSADAGGGQTAATSITQPVVSNDGDTNFPFALNSIATNYLTAGGTGATASAPQKNLFIVTDGIEDYTPNGGSRTLGPVSSSAAVDACNKVKALGISIYVLYTPYTPLPYNPFYVSNIATYINNPPTPNDTIQALQACASSPSYYYEADVPSQIATGLNTLLKAAISSPARINS
jgi:hypothetical protein